MAETARRTNQPKIMQLSVFLENRVGLLLKLTKQLEAKSVHICGVSIIDTADVAIIRLVVDNVAGAKKALEDQRLSVYETELVAVECPITEGIGVASILGTLLRAELNVHYMYPLITRVNDHPVLAFHVEDHTTAIKILQAHDLELVDQDDISWEGSEGS